MFERFTESAILVVTLAQEETKRLSLKRVGSEQLLLGLISQGRSKAAAALKQAGLTLKAARKTVKKMPFDPSTIGPKRPLLQEMRILYEPPKDIPFSDNAKAILFKAAENQPGAIAPEDIFLAALDLNPGRFAEVLSANNVTAVQLKEALNQPK